MKTTRMWLKWFGAASLSAIGAVSHGQNYDSQILSADGQSTVDYQAVVEPSLEERMAQLEAEVTGLRQELAERPTEPDLPVWTPPPAKPAAPAFPKVKLTGFFQLDAGWFNQDAANLAQFGDIEDDRGFRRARLAAVGDVAESTSYSIEMDFAFPGRPSFMDVWVEQHDLPVVGNMRVGQFRTFFGLSEMTSVRELTFLERPTLFAFAPFRQTGVGFHDTFLDEAGTWGVCGFGFPTDFFGDSIGDSGYGMSGRVTGLAYQAPDEFSFLHVGGGYVLVQPTDDILRYRNTPEYGGPFGGIFGNTGSVPAFVDTGVLAANQSQVLNAELAGGIGSLHVSSEARYAVVDLDGGGTATLPGAYVESGYFLTGERRPYNRANGVLGRVVPLSPVGKCGGPGAWEVAARYSYINLNDDAIQGGRLSDATLGLNWYLNQYTKFQINYIRAMLDRAPQGDSDANIVAVRAQLDF